MINKHFNEIGDVSRMYRRCAKGYRVNQRQMTAMKRMTHEQTKAQTRTRLIAAGREHFLRYGFSKSTAENITQHAGYTRGALYSNLRDKEGLFLAVIRDIRTQSIKAFGQLADDKSGEELFEAIRLANVDLFSTPEYRLRLEFELECLRNKTLRESYREVDEEILKYACNLLDKIRATSDIHFAMSSQDFILSIQSLGCGLTMKQLLIQPVMSHEDVRRIMLSYFDLAVFRAKRKLKGQAAS